MPAVTNHAMVDFVTICGALLSRLRQQSMRMVAADIDVLRQVC